MFCLYLFFSSVGVCEKEEKKELVAVNTENNIQNIINMEHTPENMQTLQDNFSSNLEKFKELSSTLESKKSEIDSIQL